MTRLIQQHPTLAAHSLSRLVLAVLVALLLTASAADAALTTSACLVQKRKAWITFRKCQGTEQVKLLKGKPTDLTGCDAALQTALTKIDDKATKAGIACRYRDNGNGTVTDYDTGLQWEKKDGEVEGICLLIFGLPNHCVNFTYTWEQAQSFVSPVSTDGTTVPSFLAGSADWRLPTVVELRTILLKPFPCDTSPCIDPVFGPTAVGAYRSASSHTVPSNAWYVIFDDGYVGYAGKDFGFYVRAVRTAL